MIQEDIGNILPASEAFREGTLEMSDSAIQYSFVAGSQAQQIIFSAFLVVFLVLTVVSLRDIIRLIPLLAQCLTRKSACLHMEHSVKNSYDRNFMAFVMLLPFCLAVDRFDLYRPRFLESIPHGWMALVALGFALLYVLVRFLMASMVGMPHRAGFDNWRAVRRTSLTYFIFFVFIAFSSIGTMTLFQVCDETVRQVVYWEMAGIYLLSFLRSAQFLRENCSVLGTFLYLCALELIPAGALVASVIFY